MTKDVKAFLIATAFFFIAVFYISIKNMNDYVSCDETKIIKDNFTLSHFKTSI